MDVKIKFRGAMVTWKFPPGMIQTGMGLLGEDEAVTKRVLRNLIVRLATVIDSGNLEGAVNDAEVVCLMNMSALKDLPEDFKSAIDAILDGWRTAEESISGEARTALRVTERIVPVLLGCANRDEFEKFFSQDVYPNCESGEIKTMARFFQVLAEWTEASELPVKADSHYIEKFLERVFKTHVRPAFASKKKAIVAKRLSVAASTISEYAD